MSARLVRVKASTPVEQWPLYLTVQEVAVLLNRSPRYLVNQAGKGRCWPPPVSDDHGYVKPYRFSRDTVADVLSGKLSRPSRLVHPRRAVALRMSA